MPQKYRIMKAGATSDPIADSYYFSCWHIHEDYNGTQDGRFYSKADARRCLLECFTHYEERERNGLDSVPHVFNGDSLLLGQALYYIVKA